MKTIDLTLPHDCGEEANYIEQCHKLLDGVNIPDACSEDRGCVELHTRLAVYIEMQKTANFPENK